MNKQKNFYIYKTTNLLDNTIYIGQRSCKCKVERDTGYIGSGTIMTNFYNKYGKTIFKKEIVEIVTLDTINEREIYWIAYYKELYNDQITNLHKGGGRGKDDLPITREEARRKNSEGHKGKKLTLEHKNKISKGQKGKIIYPETIEKCRQTKIKNGTLHIPKTEEQKEIARQTALEKFDSYTEEEKQAQKDKAKTTKIENGTWCKPLSEEHIKTLVECSHNRIYTPEKRYRYGDGNRGRVQPQEEKDKRSESLKGRQPSQATIEGCKLYRLNNPSPTEETKQKISNTLKNKPLVKCPYCRRSYKENNLTQHVRACKKPKVDNRKLTYLVKDLIIITFKSRNQCFNYLLEYKKSIKNESINNYSLGKLIQDKENLEKTVLGFQILHDE